MMTETIHQKVRRRRPVSLGFLRLDRKAPSLLSFDARGGGTGSFLSQSGSPSFRPRRRRRNAGRILFFPFLLVLRLFRTIAASLRSGIWKRRLRSMHPREGVVSGKTPGSGCRKILSAVRSLAAKRSRYFYPVLSGLGLALFCGALAFESSISALWAGEFRLPAENEVEGLLQSYIEPPASEIRAGELKQIDASKFTSLSLVRHRLITGDTISGIAKKYGLNLDTVVSLNQIEDARRIPIGAVLKIPNQDGVLYSVRRGDSLSSIGKAFNVSMNAIADVNGLESSTIHPGQDVFVPGARMRPMELKKILGELFIYPTNGVFSSGFGPRNDPFTGVLRFHNGVDLAGPLGTPVYAAMAGKVAKIGFHPSYGRYIIMSHSSGYQTWYAHLQKALVAPNASVAQGETIGEMGNTGYSTGPHLHFSVFRDGSPVDPMQFLH